MGPNSHPLAPPTWYNTVSHEGQGRSTKAWCPLLLPLLASPIQYYDSCSWKWLRCSGESIETDPLLSLFQWMSSVRVTYLAWIQIEVGLDNPSSLRVPDVGEPPPTWAHWPGMKYYPLAANFLGYLGPGVPFSGNVTWLPLSKQLELHSPIEIYLLLPGPSQPVKPGIILLAM